MNTIKILKKKGQVPTEIRALLGTGRFSNGGYFKTSQGRGRLTIDGKTFFKIQWTDNGYLEIEMTMKRNREYRFGPNEWKLL